MYTIINNGYFWPALKSLKRQMEIPRPKNWFTLVKITICLSKNSFQKSYNTKNVMAELSKKAHSLTQQQKRKLLYGGQERGRRRIKKGVGG